MNDHITGNETPKCLFPSTLLPHISTLAAPPTGQPHYYFLKQPCYSLIRIKGTIKNVDLIPQVSSTFIVDERLMLLEK